MIPLALPLAPVVAGGVSAGAALLTIGTAAHLLRDVSQFHGGGQTQAPPQTESIGWANAIQPFGINVGGARLPAGNGPPPPPSGGPNPGTIIAAATAAGLGAWQHWQTLTQGFQQATSNVWAWLNRPALRGQITQLPGLSATQTVKKTLSPRKAIYWAPRTGIGWNGSAWVEVTSNSRNPYPFGGVTTTNIVPIDNVTVDVFEQYPGALFGRIVCNYVVRFTGKDSGGQTVVWAYSSQFEQGTGNVEIYPDEADQSGWVTTQNEGTPAPRPERLPAIKPATFPAIPPPSPQPIPSPAEQPQPETDPEWRPFVPPTLPGTPQEEVWQRPGPMVPGAPASPLFDSNGVIRLPLPGPIWQFPQTPSGPGETETDTGTGQGADQGRRTIPTQAPFYRPGRLWPPGPLPLQPAPPQIEGPTETDGAGELIPEKKGPTTTTSPTSHFVNGQEIAAPSAVGTLEAIATELQRVEKKLELALTEGTPTTSNKNVVPEVEWVVTAPCDKDAADNPLVLKYKIPAGDYLPAILGRLEAAMAAFSGTIAWRQPVCKGHITNNVTITAYSVDDRIN